VNDMESGSSKRGSYRDNNGSIFSCFFVCLFFSMSLVWFWLFLFLPPSLSSFSLAFSLSNSASNIRSSAGPYDQKNQYHLRNNSVSVSERGSSS